MSDIAAAPANKAYERLILARDMTARTGIVHQCQVDQLKFWGKIHFQGGFELEYDAELKHVRYRGKVEKGDKEARGHLLDIWVKKLFGPDWYVEVSEGLNLVYRGVPEYTKKMTWEVTPKADGTVTVEGHVVEVPPPEQPSCPTPSKQPKSKSSRRKKKPSKKRKRS